MFEFQMNYMRRDDNHRGTYHNGRQGNKSNDAIDDVAFSEEVTTASPASVASFDFFFA